MTRCHGWCVLILLPALCLGGCQSDTQPVSSAPAAAGASDPVPAAPPADLCARWGQQGNLTVVARADAAGRLTVLRAEGEDLLALADRQRRPAPALFADMLRRTARHAQDSGHRKLVVHYDVDAGSADLLLGGQLPMSVLPVTDQPMLCSIEMGWN
jgi:hypothetical protein